ncbi:MAG: peptidoglycan-associated lipoprotein Pal [Betaproteobacteria bacterium]|nr:peptidoglycan-associated lipoprotein Pal [Betaproteobacteria bacterium]
MTIGRTPYSPQSSRGTRGALAAWAVVAALGLAACGSKVKLNEAEVEDRTATAVGAASTATPVTPSPSANSGAVAPVDLSKPSGQDTAGPAGAARVIFFDYDSFTLRADAAALIDAHARFLKASGSRKIVIEGHTDERGGREYNLALGQKRAEAVRKALALLGVSDAQMEAVSLGKEKLADAGHDESAHSRNRRAEIVYR